MSDVTDEKKVEKKKAGLGRRALFVLAAVAMPLTAVKLSQETLEEAQHRVEADAQKRALAELNKTIGGWTSGLTQTKKGLTPAFIRTVKDGPFTHVEKLIRTQDGRVMYSLATVSNKDPVHVELLHDNKQNKMVLGYESELNAQEREILAVLSEKEPDWSAGLARVPDAHDIKLICDAVYKKTGVRMKAAVTKDALTYTTIPMDEEVPSTEFVHPHRSNKWTVMPGKIENEADIVLFNPSAVIRDVQAVTGKDVTLRTHVGILAKIMHSTQAEPVVRRHGFIGRNLGL